jgi:hypothetical protein
MSSAGSLRIMRFEEGLGFVQLSFGYNWYVLPFFALYSFGILVNCVLWINVSSMPDWLLSCGSSLMLKGDFENYTQNFGFWDSKLKGINPNCSVSRSDLTQISTGNWQDDWDESHLRRIGSTDSSYDFSFRIERLTPKSVCKLQSSTLIPWRSPLS